MLTRSKSLCPDSLMSALFSFEVLARACSQRAQIPSYWAEVPLLARSPTYPQQFFLA